MGEKLISGFCNIKKPPPCGILIFGASGHLANRKVIPSLFSLYEKKLLNKKFFIAGCARTEMTDADFRKQIKSDLKEKFKKTPKELISSFLENVYYISGDYHDKNFYSVIYNKLTPLLKTTNNSLIIYLSTPPLLFKPITCKLKGAQLIKSKNTRIIIEKPFGKDMQDALQVNKHLQGIFNESQIYRIDHYLGKDTVQNILMFRFANTIFEPAWNRNYIDNIQIRADESVGIENRAGYFENTGTLLDMFQNHILRLLTLVAMEPPSNSDSKCLRDERVKVFRALRHFSKKNISENIVRAQYKAGVIDNKKVSAYRKEKEVSPVSTTETFFAAKLFIDNRRWSGVPFYVETGKRLKQKMTRITVTFKKVPYSVFSGLNSDEINPNVFTFDIQPNEGLSLKIQNKSPSLANCLETETMNFNYTPASKQNIPDAYERLLLDCMLGDQTLFVRSESIRIAWDLVTPLLSCWQNMPKLNPLRFYTAGTDRPKEAEYLLTKDGRKWH